jgi:hypothetical protein
MALNKARVASIKRTIFFIGKILRGKRPLDPHLIFFVGGNPKCSKNARWKTGDRRYTDRIIVRLDCPNLGLDDDSALVPRSSRSFANYKVRIGIRFFSSVNRRKWSALNPPRLEKYASCQSQPF